MTDPIDPLRRIDPARRRVDEHARRDDEAPLTEDASGALVPVDPPVRARELPPERRRNAFAAFAAQLLGQNGQKRGLRGGKPVLDAARTAYLESEYAGPLDRRIAKGRVSKDV